MGKRRGSRPRTICRFVCFKDKEKTLQNAKKLKNTGTYNLLFSITEVLSYCRVVILVQNQILNLKILKLLKYNIADNTPDIYLDNSCDLDVNFFNVNFHNSPNCFSITHLNVTSIKRHRKLLFNLHKFYFQCYMFFWNMVAWLTSRGNASYEWPNYKSKHQVRGDRMKHNGKCLIQTTKWSNRAF